LKCWKGQRRYQRILIADNSLQRSGKWDAAAGSHGFRIIPPPRYGNVKFPLSLLSPRKSAFEEVIPITRRNHSLETPCGSVRGNPPGVRGGFHLLLPDFSALQGFPGWKMETPFRTLRLAGNRRSPPASAPRFGRTHMPRDAQPNWSPATYTVSRT
jgi:hypothetical protein